jgi:hypothetical protein
MATPTLTRKQFLGRRLELFTAWLTARGAEVLTPTNEWEMLRFRTEKGTSIVYSNKRGQLTWMNQAGEAYLAHVSNKSSWRGVPKTERQLRSSVVCQALRDRDGDACFYCHLPVAIEEESPEHLVAVTHGGPDHIANMALAHRVCNQQAGHASLMEKIGIRETNWRRMRTPGTLPNLALAEGEPVLVTLPTEEEQIEDLFDRSGWPPPADETTPPWSK